MVKWVGKGTYMVLWDAAWYGPWETRQSAEKWLEAREGRRPG